MVKPDWSNFRMITAIIFDIPVFQFLRKSGFLFDCSGDQASLPALCSDISCLNVLCSLFIVFT